MATSPPLIPRARRPALIPYHEDLSLALAAAAKYSSPVSSPVDEDREVHRGGKGDLRADLGDWINSPDDDIHSHSDYFYRPSRKHQNPQYSTVTHDIQPITRFPGLMIDLSRAAVMGMDSVPASPTARSSPAEVEMQMRRVAAGSRNC